jgi:hypothetical protein
LFPTLVDWTKHADNGIKYFSGTATYRRTIEVTAEQAVRRAVLQLGDVSALARVRLNGRDLGVVWTAPWQVELTSELQAGANRLEIEVTNPWANRTWPLNRAGARSRRSRDSPQRTRFSPQG